MDLFATADRLEERVGPVGPAPPFAAGPGVGVVDAIKETNWVQVLIQHQLRSLSGGQCRCRAVGVGDVEAICAKQAATDVDFVQPT